MNNTDDLQESSLDLELDGLYEELDAVPKAEEIEKTLALELETVQDVVRYLVSCFAGAGIYLGHGTVSLWDEALELVNAVMHLTPPCDESTLCSRLSLKERKVIAKMASLRIDKRIPLPYLTHRAFFCAHEFYVDRRVIVPRSPLGELIDNDFAPYLKKDPRTILDMCTGSGCIAVASALHYCGNCEVDAVDISDEALEVANINIQGYGLEDLVVPIKSDLFDDLPEGCSYDLILANPPYVDRFDLENMPKEYESEPKLALGSGEDGLDCAKRILSDAPYFLNEGGVLIMEVGNSCEHLFEEFPDVPFIEAKLVRGGVGVVVINKDTLVEYHDLFFKAAKEVENAR